MAPANSRNAGFTLMEIMIIIAIIGVILMMALPGWIQARAHSRRNVCQENLTQIDGAKYVWALQNSKYNDDTPGWDDLVGEDSYIRKSPGCPAGGTYVLNPVDTEPTCSLSSDGHAMP